MLKIIRLIPIIIVITGTLTAQQVYQIKMATIAPENSSWMLEMRKFEKELLEESNGRIKFKIYPNAIQGGEKDVLRKMRLGQLHAGTFTGVGLGEIVPEIRVLELPFLFRNKAEVDYVYGAMFAEFQQKFLEKGFLLTGWAEVGFIYLYTHAPVLKLEDFSRVKMWLWKDDPLARAAFEVMRISAIPLDVTDVHTSLQTGLIDGVYISPYGLIALQWYTKVDHMLNYPLTNSIGAVLMNRKELEKMPPELQQLLITKTQIYMRQIVEQSRQENLESIRVLREAGITVNDVNDPKIIRDIEAAGRKTRENLVGKLYPQEVLDRVLTLLAEYRAQNGQ